YLEGGGGKGRIGLRDPGSRPRGRAEGGFTEEEPERGDEGGEGEKLPPSGEEEPPLRDAAHPAVLDGVLGDFAEELALQEAEPAAGGGLLVHRGEEGGAEVGMLLLDAPGDLAEVGSAGLDARKPDGGGEAERAEEAEDDG